MTTKTLARVFAECVNMGALFKTMGSCVYSILSHPMLDDATRRDRLIKMFADIRGRLTDLEVDLKLAHLVRDEASVPTHHAGTPER